MSKRIEIAKKLFPWDTEGRIIEAAEYVVAEGKKYQYELDLLEAIARLIEVAPKSPRLTTTEVSAVAVAGKSDAGAIVGASRQDVEVRAEGITVREAAESIAWQMYEAYMGPIWAEQLAEEQRLQSNRAQGLAASEAARQRREARQAELHRQNQAVSAELRRKGNEDQLRRQAELRNRR